MSCRIVGNFQGISFSWIGDFYQLIFNDLYDHAHCTLYNHAYFANFIFAFSRLSAKTVPLANFPLFHLGQGILPYLNPATSTPDREGEDLGVHLKLLSLLENPAVIVAAAAYCHSQRLPLQTPSRCTYKY